MLKRPVTSDSCAVGEITDNCRAMVGFFDGSGGNLAAGHRPARDASQAAVEKQSGENAAATRPPVGPRMETALR